jgi:hypothetical protein
MKSKIENFLFNFFNEKRENRLITIAIIFGILTIVWVLFHAKLGIVNRPY